MFKSFRLLDDDSIESIKRERTIQPEQQMGKCLWLSAQTVWSVQFEIHFINGLAKLPRGTSLLRVNCLVQLLWGDRVAALFVHRTCRWLQATWRPRTSCLIVSPREIEHRNGKGSSYEKGHICWIINFDLFIILLHYLFPMISASKSHEATLLLLFYSIAHFVLII
jgi:hypothetical protein